MKDTAYEWGSGREKEGEGGREREGVEENVRTGEKRRKKKEGSGEKRG